MSQIYKSLASGPVPPSVAQEFETQDGTAVPAANILIIDAYDSTEDNDNGITVKGGTAAGDPPDMGNGSTNEVSIYLTNRIVVTATTSDGGGQTQSVALLTPANSTSFSYRALIDGYDTVNNECAGGAMNGIGRKSAGVVTIIGSNDTLDEADAGLAAADWDVIASGVDLQFQFTGIAGRTIAWKALFEYIQSP